ncbi:FkbM family methyltransferase [Candidatus Wolfebacteria bacterium]|nr:FkbM family methyltransferase [Candidatus Wolfebacteria bacterium]
MINFSVISNKSLIGKILRSCLLLIPKNATVRILQGKLKGKKWIKGSGDNGYWLGTYELEKQKLFEKVVKKGNVVYDIGANVGFYSLLAAEIVGPLGKVFSFEPAPRNVFYLKKHIKINKFNNVVVIEAAVSDKKGEFSFFEYESNASGRLSEEGQLKVASVILDDLLKDGKILPPNVLKIDVEGAEFLVLKGAKNILNKYHPIVLLALDSHKTREDCLNLLLSFGYEILPIGSKDLRTTQEIIAKKNFYKNLDIT